MKHLFIINPIAGKGKALEYIPKIKEYFSRIKDIFFIEVTKYPGHAIELVKKYVSKDTFRVYSVGGDGTLNEVLNGMAGSNSSLAIILPVQVMILSKASLIILLIKIILLLKICRIRTS